MIKSYKVIVRATLATGKPHFMSRTITEYGLRGLRQSEQFKVVSCKEVATELKRTSGLTDKAFLDAILHNTALLNSNKWKDETVQTDKQGNTCDCCGSEANMGYVTEDNEFYCSWMCCESKGGDGLNAKYTRVGIGYKGEVSVS